MKLKKTHKAVKQRGNTTHGHGARKKWKKSGHKGGCGMAGTGKRGDQKKTLITKLYGNKYFGKQGITSKGTAKKKQKKINLKNIENNFESLMKKFGKGDVLDLKDYKLLGEGELSRKVKLRVKKASQGAIDGVEKAGGEVEVLKEKKENIINTKQDEKREEGKVEESGDKEKEVE